MVEKPIVLRVAMTEDAYRRLRREVGVDMIFDGMYDIDVDNADKDVRSAMIKAIHDGGNVTTENFDVTFPG